MTDFHLDTPTSRRRALGIGGGTAAGLLCGPLANAQAVAVTRGRWPCGAGPYGWQPVQALDAALTRAARAADRVALWGPPAGAQHGCASVPRSVVCAGLGPAHTRARVIA
jgi:hypothetical protein